MALGEFRRNFVMLSGSDVQREIDKMHDVLGGMERNMKAVVTRSINKTLTTTRKELVQEVRGTYCVPATDVRRRISLNRAKAYSLRGSLTAKGNMSVPLIRYGARPRVVRVKTRRYGRTRKGASIKMHTHGQRKLVKGAFMAFSRSRGSVQLFRRTGQKREHITPLYGPGHLSMLMGDDFGARIRMRAQERFLNVLRHEADFEAGKMGAR